MAGLFGFDDGSRPAPRGTGNLFWWGVLLILMSGVTVASWMGSFYVIGHPEQAKPYRILRAIKRIEPPKRVLVTKAPQGEFVNAGKLFNRYSKMTPLELKRKNEELLRDFIRNYADTKRKVPYLTGLFTVQKARKLTQNDYFQDGIVVLAQSPDVPQLVIEHVFPLDPDAEKKSPQIPTILPLLKTGVDIRIENPRDLAAVINAARLDDGRILLTVVPILYGRHGMKRGAGLLSLAPPMMFNVEAGLPMFHADELVAGQKAYLAYRRSLPPRSEDSPAPTAPNELLRVEVGVAGKVPITGALPDLVAVKPIQIKPPIANNPPAPAPTAIPLNRPPDDTVVLKPFLANFSPDAPKPAQAVWPLFPAGQQPKGRVILATDAGVLADTPIPPGEKYYLRGIFRVTASGENRAVMRPDFGAASAAVADAAKVRIIAEFPPVTPAPAMDATISRDELRAFEVLRATRAQDGQINLFVRDIVQPSQP